MICEEFHSTGIKFWDLTLCIWLVCTCRWRLGDKELRSPKVERKNNSKAN